MSAIVLTGGGSAGHCTPNLALIPYLREKFDNIYYIGSENGIEKQLVEKAGITYYSVSTAKLKRKICLYNLKMPFEVIKGIKECKKLIKKLKPNVVFAKGGYVSVPVVIAAKQQKIPVVIHESDFSLGLANKICLKFSNCLLTSFRESEIDSKKAKYIGCPIRKFDLTHKDYKKFNFTNKKPVLLVLGGSLGSNAINQAIFSSIKDLLVTFNILHITGKGKLNTHLMGIKGYTQIEYLFNIEEAYSIANICIARGGANSLFELLSIKIPCIIIPLSKGISRGDQEQNAEYFKKKKLITLLEEDCLTKTSLIDAVNTTYNNRRQIIYNLTQYAIHDCSRDLVNEICAFQK